MPPVDPLDPQIAAIIRHKARKLVGHYGYRRQDEEDLRQELTLHWLTACSKYNPQLSKPTTFARRVVENRAISLIRHRQAQKRSRSAETSVAFSCTNHRQRPDLKLDVDESLVAASDELQEVAGWLGRGYRVSDIVRHTGLSRQHVRTVIQHIRKHLAGSGIDEKYFRARNQPAHRLRIYQVAPYNFTLNARQSPGRKAQGHVGTLLQEETSMRPGLCAFRFNSSIPLDEVEGTLRLSQLAAGILHGAERVELEAPCQIDPAGHTVQITTTSRAGLTLAVIFLGLCRREFGRDNVMLDCPQDGGAR